MSECPNARVLRDVRDDYFSVPDPDRTQTEFSSKNPKTRYPV